MQIFRTLIETFVLRDSPQGETVIPSGWESGSSINFYASPFTLALAEGEAQPDWQKITGRVENAVFDPGSGGYYFLLQEDSGASRTIRIEPFFTFSRGDARELPLDDLLQAGRRVQVLGFPLASDEFLAQYIALEQENGWQTILYHNFFDLSQSELDPELLTYYLQSGPVFIQLYGSADQVLPLLVDEQGRAFNAERLGIMPTQQVLVYGELQTADPPRLRLERLQVLNGECLPLAIPIQVETCFYWQLLYPQEQTPAITAAIQEAIPEADVLVLAEPVEGFVTITLAPDGQLLTEDGTPIEWEDIEAGAQVQASGEVGEAGTLMTQVVTVLAAEDEGDNNG
jgi:hypothetical protein